MEEKLKREGLRLNSNQNSSTFNDLTTEFDPRKVTADIRERARQKVVEQNQSDEVLPMPDLPLPNKEEVEKQIKESYEQVRNDYGVIQEIKNGTLNDALAVYQHRELDQNQFNYIAAFIQDKLEPIFEEYNEKTNYLKFKVYISTATKSIALQIDDPNRYVAFWSSDPNVNQKLKNDADYKSRIKLLDLAIRSNSLRARFGAAVSKTISEEINQKKQDSEVNRQRIAQAYEDSYAKVLQSKMARFKKRFMPWQFDKDIAALRKQRSELSTAFDTYYQLIEKQDEITQNIINARNKRSMLQIDAQYLNLATRYLASD